MQTVRFRIEVAWPLVSPAHMTGGHSLPKVTGCMLYLPFCCHTCAYSCLLPTEVGVSMLLLFGDWWPLQWSSLGSHHMEPSGCSASDQYLVLLSAFNKRKKKKYKPADLLYHLSWSLWRNEWILGSGGAFFNLIKLLPCFVYNQPLKEDIFQNGKIVFQHQNSRLEII